LKNNKNRNAILLTLLVVLPTFMLFGTLSATVNANIPVPEPHPDNAWGWNVTVGDTFWFELEVVEKDPITGKILHMFRSFSGLNITSIDTALVNVTGLGNNFNLSRVNMDVVSYNPSSGMVEPTGSSGTMIYFGYNGTTEICTNGDFGVTPMILPLNGTSGTVDLEYLRWVLKDSYFDPLAADGICNPFNNFQADNGLGTLFIEDTVGGYFINTTYFPNGTLKESEMVVNQQFGPTGYIELHQKVKRVFNPILTSEVNWSMDIGDTFYFGDNLDGFNEKKVEITGFNLTTYFGYWDFNFNSTVPMIFEDVLADVSIWSSTLENYVLNATNVIVGTANNLYPVVPWQTNLVTPPTPFFFDLDATIDDYRFMQNNFTAKKYVQFEEVYWKTEGKFIFFEMFNHNDKSFVNAIYDSSRGVMNFIHGKFGTAGDGFILFEKNMTVVSSGSNTVELYSELTAQWDITLNFTAPGDTEVYWAVIPGNPTNVPAPLALPHEIGTYIDVYTNNTFGVGPVTITVDYDEILLNSFGIDETDLLPMGFNQTAGEWGYAPNDIYTIDTANNRIIIEFPLLFISLFTIGVNTTSRVEWSIDVSDELFFGQSGHEFRVVITAINETLRELFTGDAMSPIEMFSEVYADIYYWDMMSETWILKDTSNLVAAANNYWPFAPYYMSMENTDGPPLLYPMGTTGFDFQSLYFMFQNMFDNITIGHDRTEAYNSSSGDFDITFLDVASGVPFFKMGKRAIPGNMGSEFYSFYRKIKVPLNPGNNHLTLVSDLIPDLGFSADIAALSGGVDFLFAILPVSPVGEDIPDGNLLFYSDVMITDHSKVSQISMSVTLPPSISVDLIDLILYRWANSTYEYGGEFGYWESLPEGDMNDSVFYDANTNSIILVFEVNDPVAGVFAWAYSLSSEDVAEISGYDLLIILGLIGLASGIVIYRRRKLMLK